MDNNRVEGTKHEVKGAVKETAGKVTGEPARKCPATWKGAPARCRTKLGN